MIKNFTLLLALIAGTAFGQIEKKACFIGNSYTFANDLPGMISELATADGNTLIKDQSTPGGYTLESHSTNTATLTMISSNDWDFVILQDQSQRPSFPWDQVSEEVFPFGKILSDSTRGANECAIPLFFNTWGRRDGDDQWDSINTFTKMNQRLHVAYDYMADKNSGMLSPVGIGFEHIANDGDAPMTHSDLYVGDGSHPSTFGSYLAACVFYEIIFEVSSEGNTYLPAGVTGEEATYIQDVAHHVLTAVDSITIDYTNPEAAYSVTYDGLTASFTNESVHAFEYFWEFGDGETSTEENPVHEYPDAGPYEATLTAIYCGREDETTGGTNHSTISENNLFELAIYPNPSSSGQVTVNYSGPSETLYVFTIDGQLILTMTIDAATNITLPEGIFILTINGSKNRVIIK